MSKIKVRIVTHFDISNKTHISNIEQRGFLCWKPLYTSNGFDETKIEFKSVNEAETYILQNNANRLITQAFNEYTIKTINEYR